MTKKEAIKWLKTFKGRAGMAELSQAFDVAIETLEQQSVLDKVREEIEQITDTMGVRYNQYVSKIDVLAIIDKYKAESEE